MALIYLTSELLFPTSGASVGRNANAKLFFTEILDLSVRY